MKRRIRRTASSLGATRDRLILRLNREFRAHGYAPDIIPEDLQTVHCMTRAGDGPRWKAKIKLYQGRVCHSVSIESPHTMTELCKAGVTFVWTGPTTGAVLLRDC